jgi:predicted AAA+ superfamily ATPase
MRGGYPDSFLAASGAESMTWRDQFVRSYVERDLPQLGVRVPATTMERFWMMVAHWQGQAWNASTIAGSLGVSGPTVSRYLDTMTDACLVRQLPPYFANLKKRLVKSPKVYVRDSGVLHALHRLPDRHALFGHPVAGHSFEGFVVEQTLALLDRRADAAFYRTQTGVELDLVLTPSHDVRIGVEVKLTTAPKLERGLTTAIEDVDCTHTYVVIPAGERYPMGRNIEAIPVAEFIREVVGPMVGT